MRADVPGNAMVRGTAACVRADRNEVSSPSDHGTIDHGTIDHGTIDCGTTDRGSVTAEYAVMLPAAAIVLVGALLAGAATMQQVRLEEAAAATVRQLARGESAASATDTAHRMAGSGTSLSASRDAGWVSVTVSHAPPGPLAWWDGWELQAAAHAPDQWIVPPTVSPTESSAGAP